MARNRKSQSAAIRFVPALKAFLLCGVIVLCCVGYVWQKRQIIELSRQIHEREDRLKTLRDQNVKLRNQLVILLSPQSLDQRAKELKLGLAPAQPLQVLRLPEPAGPATQSALARQLAAEEIGTEELP